MSRGYGRAERHVLARLTATGRTMTVRELVDGYAPAGCQPTPAEYEAVRRAAATLARDGAIAFYVPQIARQGGGGWYALGRSVTRSYTTHTGGAS